MGENEGRAAGGLAGSTEDPARTPEGLPEGQEASPRGLRALLSADGNRLGSPARPLFEAGLVFAAFYLGSWLPSDPSMVGTALARPLYHLAMLAEILPKALLLLYLMHRSEGLAAFPGIERPRWADVSRAFMLALGALLIVSAFSFGLSTFLPGYRNPLLGATRAGASPSPLLIPFVLLTALAVGYAEELYFRVYLLRRLRQAGLSLGWAATGTAILFASGHGLQGWLGVVLGLALGAWFVLRRVRGASLHELAWGHAIYDAAVMLTALYYRPPA
jgi:membrane protease YdiL (CAAX protease family)